MRGIPPILIDSMIAEVSFQTERLGWKTDDFLIVCDRTAAATRKLAGQVKRNFTVSASDEDCVQTIGDFWKDFTSSDHFSPADDRLVLVTLRGTNTLLEFFVGLLDCARASRDGTEFEDRLATEGFISDKAVKYCRDLQKIIGDIEGKAVSAAEIWPFLRVLHVLSLDLHSSTRFAEAQIKSLLAYTATEGDTVAVAAASWNELVGEASTAMAEGRSLRRSDLPAALQARHGAISTNDQRVLRALKDHTVPVLRKIRSTIGVDLHLQRAALVQKVLGALEAAQVVLVAGPAGIGKSAIGKNAVAVLSRDHFTFGFRVEEFAQSHFDATLHAAQVPANHAALGVLAAQDRKVVLVESVERLLEKTTRDAFSDLMTLAADDPGLRVILTCRDYSVEQVRASFLQPARINHTVVRVPPLDDTELSEAEAANPTLGIPLRNLTLRNILRNPFFLDKALGIKWSAEKPVPESEREFRALFWREIVRADHMVAAGMGRRREQTLGEVAVRRARALSDYVVCNDLDADVIESLRRDSLIASPDNNPLLVATAHDVLEDWAILQWLEEQHLGETSFNALSAAIGAHPAVRRSYRRWVAELIERDAPAADRLFQAAISDTNISVQFRDDTLVSLLKAPLAPEFLARHEAQLVANDRAIPSDEEMDEPGTGETSAHRIEGGDVGPSHRGQGRPAARRGPASRARPTRGSSGPIASRARPTRGSSSPHGAPGLRARGDAQPSELPAAAHRIGIDAPGGRRRPIARGDVGPGLPAAAHRIGIDAPPALRGDVGPSQGETSAHRIEGKADPRLVGAHRIEGEADPRLVGAPHRGQGRPAARRGPSHRGRGRPAAHRHRTGRRG